ncbi:hypothetical protein I549_5406 [Mycobacterium avium subsp. avium 2285 (R)]|nr:hypothetical protein I549_5406 [Mycobacterium avium subsp. avium 2285 (R)]
MAECFDVTTKRALVLAGGGIAGIAWETGVLRALRTSRRPRRGC